MDRRLKDKLSSFTEGTRSEAVVHRTIHYRDPPAHVCMGITKNRIPLVVVEFWERSHHHWDFESNPTLEPDDIRPLLGARRTYRGIK